MEHDRFDRIARAMATGFSRRSMLRRAAGSAIAGPMAMASTAAVAADGNDDEKNKKKDKDKDKDKDRGNQSSPGNSACRGIGQPCTGNQECCAEFDCLAVGSGAAPRCVPRAAGGTANAVASNQVVNTNNQVCAGDCVQTNQQVVNGSASQTVIAGDTELFGRPPTYFVDVNCAFDAPAYRTVCTGTGRGGDGAPPVRKITLPTSEICAIVINEESRPEKRETIRRNVPAPSGDTNNASAGNGGVANADASGGSVTVGDIRGNNVVAIDASGGTANADASGGDGNVAIAGGGQVVEEVIEQVVEPSTVTVTLEGNVIPGKTATYWVDTDAGRRPATGPSLVQVADETSENGAIVVETRACDLPQPQQGFDWFGQCTNPAADMQFGLYPENGGDMAPLATTTANAQGRARFGNLAPGTYQVRPEGTIWCYAESDRVDANGNVLVETGAESHVWSFTCATPAGS